jgi:DNA-binding response OmpR family regulator
MHILLLEPDRLLADTYRQALIRSGHSVMMCASAQSAIFGADELQPDVVALELQLIGHSGIEFLYEFRSYSEWQSIPVLVHTHVPAGEFADSWQFMKHELGIAAYLYKPLTSLHQLIRLINALAPLPAVS